MTKKSTRLQMAPTMEPTPNGHGVGLAEWRKRKIVEGVLPSGLQVTLRKVQMMDLISEGHVPATLDALVKKATGEGFGVNDTLEFLPLVDAVVKACMVFPIVVTEEMLEAEAAANGTFKVKSEQLGDDRILLSEIPIEDRLAIFTWANAEAQQMRPFRAQPGGDVESARAGGDVSPAA